MSVLRRDVGELAGELLELAGGIVPASARRDLEEGRRRLDEGRANLVVLGEFKRGKSTLVNALVDSDLVPTGVLPLTASVTVVRHGERPRLAVSFADGSTRDVPLGEIADFATESGNPDNRRGVQLLTVELPTPLLAHGLQLVDTPGIGSTHAHNTETALGYLGRVDAALFVLAADQPLSSGEERLIRDVAARAPRVFFVLNKIDRLLDDERDEVVAFVRASLAELLGRQPELFAVSARSGEGLDRLRLRLEELAGGEHRDVLARSVRSLAAAFAAEAARAVQIEARAIELPLIELERRLAAFRERALALTRAREESAELLRQGGHRLVAESVNEPLLSLARREGPELVAQLERYAAEQGAIAPRELAALLDTWIDRTVRSRFEHLRDAFEERLAGALVELHRRHATRVESVLHELDDAATEVFGAPFDRRPPEIAIREPSRFSFKLQDPERDMLDQLTSLASASVPGRLGRRLVVRQAEERLRLMLDRHAGRLRSDLAHRIESTLREHERELGSVVDETIAAVEAAVERARREQQGGRLLAAARLDDLQLIEARLEELQALLGR